MTKWEAKAYAKTSSGKEVLFKKSHTEEGLQRLIENWYHDCLYYNGKPMQDYEERKAWCDEFIKNIRYEISK